MSNRYQIRVASPLAHRVGQLKLWHISVGLHTTAAEVEQLFLADPALPACIINAAAGIFGVLSRRSFMAAISRPFGREVFIKRPINLFLEVAIDTAPLVIPGSTTIAAALQLATCRPGETCFEPILVDLGGTAALLEINELMSSQSRQLEQTLIAKDELIEQVRRTAHDLQTTSDAQKRLAAEILRANELSQYEATHDSLTGLPNRKLFLEKLDLAVAANRADPARDAAVLFIDLDRFKIVNDSLGHLAGNDLLKQVAGRLTELVRAPDYAARAYLEAPRLGDIVARLSGDEFTLLLTAKTGADAAHAIAIRLQNALCQPFQIGVETVSVSASIGIVLTLAGYSDTETVLRDADIAMYRAKSSGKARTVIFEQAMHVQAETRLHIESRLREALAAREFELHFQPIVSLPAQAIIGAEALVRWRGPDGLIPAADFMSLAEETGLIVPISNWAFREACEVAKHWHYIMPDRTPLNLSVNLPPAQFAQLDLAAILQDALRHSGVDPAAITIEITESCTTDNPDRAILLLNQIKTMGIGITIDHFGRGDSALGYLHHLPIDTLKLDRSLTVNLGVANRGEKILAALLGMAAALGLDTIINGVENLDQLAALQALGCKYAQGPLFSPALLGSDLEALLG